MSSWKNGAMTTTTVCPSTRWRWRRTRPRCWAVPIWTGRGEEDDRCPAESRSSSSSGRPRRASKTPAGPERPTHHPREAAASPSGTRRTTHWTYGHARARRVSCAGRGDSPRSRTSLAWGRTTRIRPSTRTTGRSAEPRGRRRRTPGTSPSKPSGAIARATLASPRPRLTNAGRSMRLMPPSRVPPLEEPRRPSPPIGPARLNGPGWRQTTSPPS
mmetsp:Transcript_30862/g.92461  ORF Transcript_30862/g.92461 Transcript_30862/m.92461 type:complete len:215 (+) Transcript_30862:1868-2512(+)